ncbi:ATP-binding cassette sub-family A (ABC1) member 2 [Fasciola gigantica]|uniref:ATP-binding cassette sub-family A (ABC1) member 2 n=1 Tax=Fasciola gigantica TaxID=46835 RepID=A0A504WWP1_FASGI|nr:ATP-binding cassette sub-family A (ABC1) member 2 [Fasciola gigantica]
MVHNPDEAKSPSGTCSTGRASTSGPILKDTRRRHSAIVTGHPASGHNTDPGKWTADIRSSSRCDFSNDAFTDTSRNRTSRARCSLFGRHYSVLMWKNMILRRRRPGFLVAELIAPVLIACILVILCHRGEEERYPNCYSQTIGMPSMGLLSFSQSLVCNFAYSCFNTKPPALSLFGNETGWAELLSSTRELAKDPWIGKVASGVLSEPMSIGTLKQLNSVRISFIKLLQRYQELAKSVKQSDEPDEVITIWNMSISVSMLNRIGNMSRLICGVQPDQNDVGQLVMFLKSLNETNLSKLVPTSLVRVARDASTESPPTHKTTTTAANNTATPTPVKTFCENLVEFLLIDPIRPYTERIRFFLFTYIYYYPSTIVTDTIMRRATSLHRLLNRIRDILQQLSDRTLPGLRIYLSTSGSMNQIRQALEICVELDNEDSLICRQLWNFLQPNTTANSNSKTNENIFTLLDKIQDMTEVILKFLDCMNLNHRLIPSTKSEFEEYMKIFQYATFPSGIGVNFRRVPETLNWSAIKNTSEHIFEVALRKIGDTYKFKVFDRYWTPRPRQNPRDGDMKYFTTGFIDLQESIGQAILSIAWSKPDPLEVPVSPDELYSNRISGNQMQLFPTACYTDRGFLGSMATMLPQFMLFSWIFTAMFTAKCIVDEKEQHLKEFTKIMGVSNFTHWLGWLTMNLLIMFPCSVLITILLKYGGVVRDTNYGILLFLFASFTLSVIALTFLCSTFFTHANLGAVVTGMIYFILYLPTPMILTNEANLSPGTFYGASLSSQVAFSLGFYYILRTESYGTRTEWETFWSSNQLTSEFSVGKAVLMLWVDTAIYLILTWYIEAIYPGRYGVQKPFYFPFTRSYWYGARQQTISTSKLDKSKALGNSVNPRFFEPAPAHAMIGIAVRNLTKRYKKRAKPALDGLSMNFYANQVTSLLGHNGAGKSTLMAILTGMQSASSGLALVAGHDVGKQLEVVRDMLGFCPQYNVLFDQLTVAEHIRFYAAMKGIPNQVINTETDQLMELLGFPDKRNDRSKSLSGGQKRKLSVAIAFVGRSKVVFLDEPTAGVDPYSRRSIWDLIICLKQGRTIVLTTHHMDEADILGDRIAVISQGRLKCEGSSLFLKANHGQGYHLILQRGSSGKNPTADQSNPIHNQSVLDYVRHFMPAAEVFSVDATELTLQLPGHYATDGTFSTFFSHLESNPPHHVPETLLKLGIVSYGLSDTSLEEVFLEMAEDPANQSELSEEAGSIDTLSTTTDSQYSTRHEDNNKKTCNMEEGKESKVENHAKRRNFSRHRSPLTQLRHSSRLQRFTDGGQLPTPATRQSLIDRRTLFARSVARAKNPGTANKSHAWPKPFKPENLRVSVTQQLRAMFLKRFHYFKRHKRGWIIQFLLPVLLTLLAMGFISIVVIVKVVNPPMPLNPWWMIPEHGVLSTFYENNAYAVEDPQEWPLSSEMIHQVAMEYERALGTVFGWTGTRCLPKDIYQFIPKKHDSCENNWTTLPSWKPEAELSASERAEARNSSEIRCSCETGRTICPAHCVQPNPPPHIQLQTTDLLYNLTAYNVNDYLLKTHDEFFLRRFGGLSFVTDPSWPIRGLFEYALDPRNPLYLALGMLTPIRNGTSGPSLPDPVWSELANSIRMMLPPTHHMLIWFNNKGYVSSVGYLNMLQNMQLRMAHGVDKITERKSHGIVIIDHPLEPIANFTAKKTNTLIYDVTLALFTILASSFIPASFITFLVLEVQTGSKHLQFVSGLNGYIYWFGAYLWDIANYLVPATLCVLVFVAFQKNAYVGKDSIGAFFGLMILYGLSVLPMLYPSSFFIRNPSTALVIVAVFNLLLGAVTVMVTFLLDILEQDDRRLAPINSVLQAVFLIFPQYAFGRGLYNLSFRYYVLTYRDSGLFDPTRWENPTAWKVVGRNLFAMGLESVFYSTLVVLIEHKFYQNAIRDYFYAHYQSLRDRRVYPLRKRLLKLNREEGEVVSEDVREEQDRVHQLKQTGSLHSNSSVSSINLVKFFRRKKKPTVNQLTFAVRPAECFGLLGVNGAGKTTTFRILSGSLLPTMGEAFVNGFHVVDQRKQAHQSLGYCPQFDALLDLLTGRETLTLYARLRGVPENDITQVVSQLLSDMSLAPHADKIVRAYSGGNRRKLSTAVALLGGPKVIFLDEPTSGMDPVGKRFLWDQIINLLHCGKSVVLSSHSMEECETLCNRLGIMVNGQFRCFGTVQQLKDRFGNGYTAELHVSDRPAVGDRVRAIIEAEFAHIKVNNTQTRCHEYQFDQGISLSRLFALLNKMKKNRMIEQYSVRQTTLDQVFVNFTRMQMEQSEVSQITEDLSDTEADSIQTPSTVRGVSNEAFHPD